MGDRFPAMFELFRHTSATFGKAGIADRFAIHQYFSPCLVDHLLDDRVGSTGISLVALTMVVGTDIENVMAIVMYILLIAYLAISSLKAKEGEAGSKNISLNNLPL